MPLAFCLKEPSVLPLFGIIPHIEQNAFNILFERTFGFSALWKNSSSGSSTILQDKFYQTKERNATLAIILLNKDGKYGYKRGSFTICT